ncbi:MAG: hypothetical protein WCK67_10965 [bacterium]
MINNHNFNQSNITFKSQKLFPVAVKDMADGYVKGWITKLDPSDPEDSATMKKVGQEWRISKYPGVVQGKILNNEFNSGHDCFAVELDSFKKSLYDKLLCLSSTEIKDELYLSCLQAAPNSTFEAGTNRKYKGAGTALMYGILNIALKTKDKICQFSNANKPFYKSLNIPNTNTDKDIPDYTIYDSSGMEDFIQRKTEEWKPFLSNKEND